MPALVPAYPPAGPPAWSPTDLPVIEGGGASFDYYVDSAGGDDGNDGGGQARAFASFAPLTALGTLPEGSRIGVARGSTGLGELNVAGDGITVASYGSGERPIVDCRDIASGWSATGGRTDVWQATITLPGESTGLGNVWADEALLVQVDDLDDVESNAAGEAFVSDWTADGSATLCLHSESDPDGTGVVYRYSARAFAITGAGDGFTVRGIRARGQLSYSASVHLPGAGCLVDDCVIEDGNRHNLQLGAGGRMLNTTVSGFRDDLEAAYTAVPMVFYDQSIAGTTLYSSGCTFDVSQGNSDDRTTALIAHDDGAGKALLSTHDDATFIGLRGGAINAHAETVVLNRPTFTNAAGVIAAAGVAVEVNDIQAGSIVRGRVAVSSNGGSALLDGGAWVASAFGDGHIYGSSTAADFDVTVSDAVIDIQDVPSSYPRFFAHVKRGTLTMNDTTIGPAIGSYTDRLFFLGDGATGAFVGDNNVYPYGAKWQLNGTTYTTLAAWQAATGEDANSVYGTPVPAISDDFDRADENLEASDDWTRIGGSAGVVTVDSNQMRFTAGTHSLYHLPDQGDPDHWAEATITAGIGSGAYDLVIRAVDENNFIAAQETGTQWRLIKYLDGVQSILGATSGVTPAEGDLMTLAADGPWITFCVNKEFLLVSYLTDEILLGGTLAGVVPRTSAGTYLDDFKHGPVR